ncbi:MAG: lysophospholipid acyltransferase family protein [Planctomycetota bacterium]
MNLQGWRRIPVPKTIIFLAEYFIFRWFIFFLTALPLNIVISLVKNLARLIYNIDWRYKKIAVENILLANPPIVSSDSQANELALHSYEHFALSFAHILYAKRFNRLKSRKYVHLENSEIIDNALKKNKGVLLVGAHLGNWEICITELGKQGYPINLVAFQYVNPYLNNMMNRFRLDCGVTIIPTKGAISKCEEALKKGEIVIMLIDQTGRDAGVEAQFFGRIAPAMWGSANLSLKTGATIIPFGIYHRPDPIIQSSQSAIHYTAKFSNMINYQPTGNKDDDIKKLTQIYLNEIEKIIRRAPEQWIWFHRRWKKYK